MKSLQILTVVGTAFLLFSTEPLHAQDEHECNPIPKHNLVLGSTFGAGSVLAAAGAIISLTAEPSTGQDPVGYGLTKMMIPLLAVDAVVFGIISARNFVLYKKHLDACKKVSFELTPSGTAVTIDF